MNSTPSIHTVFACIRCGLIFNNFHSAKIHYLTDPRHSENVSLLSTLSTAGHVCAVASTIDVLLIATPGQAAAARIEAIGYIIRSRAPQQPPKTITGSTQAIDVYTNDDNAEELPPRKRRRLASEDAEKINPEATAPSCAHRDAPVSPRPVTVTIQNSIQDYGLDIIEELT